MLIPYILFRLFVPKKNYYLEGDELRYLSCAKDFYKLWNKSFYDTHPPFYSWLIKFFGATQRAGVLISFGCSIALFFVCSALYDLLGLTPYQKQVALAFLTLNYTLIYYSNRVFRYQLIALLGTSALYFGLLHQYLISGLLLGLLNLTCVYAGLRGFWIWLVTGFNPWALGIYLWYMWVWIWEKFNVYFSHKYYPAGIDGKIEPMRGLNMERLFSPMYFPFTHAYYGKRELGYDFKNWRKKIGGVFGLYQTNYKKLNILLGTLTVIISIITLKGMASAPLPLVLLTLILLYPSLLKRFLPRNSILAIPLLGFFIGKGLPIVSEICLYLGLGACFLGFLWFNRVLCLTKPQIKSRLVSRFLDSLPKDGVLVEGLIAYPIAYRSQKRVIVMPHAPDWNEAVYQAKLSIKEFDLHYAVFSELYKTEVHLGYPVIDYIKKFKLLKTFNEDGDKYYVYEISAS